MDRLHVSFMDICNMPFDQFEWFYNRHNQHLIDLQKERDEQQNKFI